MANTMNQTPEKALVVLSGGQDSTTCLYWALRTFGRGNVEAVTFDYGQRHRVELDCARKISELAGVRQTVLPIDTFAAIGGNALTDADIAPEDGARDDDALPNTFVPGRNLVFLTFAAALAYTAARATWSPASPRPTTPATPIAAKTPSRRWKWRCAWAWTAGWSCTRR